MPVLEVNSELADAAFGATPGRAAAGLPVAGTAPESWLRAVALGGVGHYAAAHAELRRARRSSSDPILRSLTHSTEGSLLRQLGWHTHAAVADGRAAALVLSTPSAPGRHGVAAESEAARAEAVCDALTGLAADALGTARPALAARLLHRCQTEFDTHLSGVEAAWRQRVRLHWVCAETALCSPGSGLITAPPGTGGADSRHVSADPALAHAEAALELAEKAPSLRHRVKSRLLVAAASAAAGDLGRSLSLAIEVDAQCRELELLPLRWACAMLRSGLDPTGNAAAEAAVCSRLLAARGGGLRSDSGLLDRP
ncbi:hypothetical protein AB0N05_22505 [Nocardia sp. NPDC051030]|uniref:hypothetical protein n=1 Tax=Nocardia sp. NPDC051030 TaxID=3155162 RepID=UPI00342CC37C